MIVLGVNAYHGDAAACIVRDGCIVAAVEEERFRRIKHWAGFPSQSIRYCLDAAEVSIGDIDHLAINSDPKASFARRAIYAMSHLPDPRLLVDRLRNQHRRLSIESDLAADFPSERFRGAIHRVEHHLAHLASAYFSSALDCGVVVSVDGFGDFASAAWGVGEKGTLRVDGRVAFPHSLGVFYQAITQYLGFWDYGDEYKVMGLAPYGAPTFRDEMRRVLRLGNDGGFTLDLNFFLHHREKVAYRWNGGAPQVGRLYSQALADLFGPPRGVDGALDQRFLDVARSAQDAYEESLFHLLRRLHDDYRLDGLALAGGCAMNSVANGKILRHTTFKHIYVPAAAGDAGGAVGAALYVHSQFDTKCARQFCDHAYLGPDADSNSIARALAARTSDLAIAGCGVADGMTEEELCNRTARALADGSVVGWFQGRMEWGPRALGNRSILADPRRADMKETLNSKIKRRESFRPFAPSILAEYVSAWYEEDADVPFMSEVLHMREEKRSLAPAVTHVDGSSRPQTVRKHTNPRYHKLISAFYEITGVPMVLNTSFNESEPIVCRPEEALDCFLRTNMDLLVLGDVMISRGGGN